MIIHTEMQGRTSLDADDTPRINYQNVEKMSKVLDLLKVTELLISE